MSKIGLTGYIALFTILAFFSFYLTLKSMAKKGENSESARMDLSYKFMVLTLILQISFLTMYLTQLLTKIPIWLADIYWITSGASGIAMSIITAKRLKRVTILSCITGFIGILLLLLLVLSIGITSM